LFFFPLSFIYRILGSENAVIDYRNTRLLSTFLTEGGRILNRRFTGLSAKHQRQLARAVKRARNVGLLPFLGRDDRADVFVPFKEAEVSSVGFRLDDDSMALFFKK